MNPPSTRIVHSKVDKGLASIILLGKSATSSRASRYSFSRPMSHSVSMASIAVAPRCPNALLPVLVMGSSSSSPYAYFLYPCQECRMASLTAALLLSLRSSFFTEPPLALAATSALYAGVRQALPIAWAGQFVHE